VQILALLLTRRSEGAALVVAPTSVCSNWAREAARFAPDLAVLEYTGDGRSALLEQVRENGNGKLLICSYALLQQDQAKLTELSFGTAVLDEAQFIKNSQSLRAQATHRRHRHTGRKSRRRSVEHLSFHEPGHAGRFFRLQPSLRQADRT